MLFGQKIIPQCAQCRLRIRDSLKQFAEVLQHCRAELRRAGDSDKAIYNGAIPGMLHVLDPASNFFDPSSIPCSKRPTAAEYYGVGMTVGPRNVNNRTVVIVMRLHGHAGLSCGHSSGDIISAVDGKSTDNMKYGDVAIY